MSVAVGCLLLQESSASGSCNKKDTYSYICTYIRGPIIIVTGGFYPTMASILIKKLILCKCTTLIQVILLGKIQGWGVGTSIRLRLYHFYNFCNGIIINVYCNSS